VVGWSVLQLLVCGNKFIFHLSRVVGAGDHGSLSPGLAARAGGVDLGSSDVPETGELESAGVGACVKKKSQAQETACRLAVLA